MKKFAFTTISLIFCNMTAIYSQYEYVNELVVSEGIHNYSIPYIISPSEPTKAVTITNNAIVSYGHSYSTILKDGFTVKDLEHGSFRVSAPYGVKYWEARFNEKILEPINGFENYPAMWEAHSLSGDSYLLYGLMMPIDAYTAMYEATSNIKYIDFALQLTNNVLSTANEISAASELINSSEVYGEFIGWDNSRDNSKFTIVPLDESIFFRYVVKMLRIIKNTPDLYDDSNYSDQYDSILTFVQKNIWDKWFTVMNSNDSTIGWNGNVFYRERTHMTSHWAYIALDLYILTDDTKYQEVYDNINTAGLARTNYTNSSLRDQNKHLDIDGNYYSWYRASWDAATMGITIQDVEHGNHVVSYIVEAYDQGIHWGEDDIIGLSLLLKDIIWGAHPNNIPHDFLDQYWMDENDDGKQDIDLFDSYHTKRMAGTGKNQNDGWVKLGRYNLDIQYLLQSKSQSGTIQNNAQFFANMALNIKILSEFSSLKSTEQENNLQGETEIFNQEITDIRIYPNPNSGVFKVKLNMDFDGVKLLSIFDITGKIIYETFDLESSSVEIDLSNIPKGIYLLKAIKDQTTFSRKIIID